MTPDQFESLMDQYVQSQLDQILTKGQCDRQHLDLILKSPKVRSLINRIALSYIEDEETGSVTGLLAALASAIAVGVDIGKSLAVAEAFQATLER